MSLLQYKLNIENTLDIEPISSYLFEQGAISLTIEDAKDTPIFSTNDDSHPLWDHIIVNVLFDLDQFQANETRVGLTDILGYPPNDSIENFVDEDWQKKWEQDTKPIYINEQLIIYPTHHPKPNNSNAKCIKLDPGIAFGTGHHTTTRLCLEWLCHNNIDNFSVIDYGCGSGILSIASILFNAKSVTAIDNDPLALESTTENCKKNSIPHGKIKTYLPEDAPLEQVDLIIANIYLNVLIEIRPIISKNLKRGGILILTGLLIGQKDKILSKYSDFDVVSQIEQDGWLLLVCRNGK